MVFIRAVWPFKRRSETLSGVCAWEKPQRGSPGVSSGPRSPQISVMDWVGTFHLVSIQEAPLSRGSPLGADCEPCTEQTAPQGSRLVRGQTVSLDTMTVSIHRTFHVMLPGLL